MSEEKKPLSRSEREALIKDKAGWVITVLAALLAINTLMGGSNSSKVLNNTIAANDTWSFYQAKSIKQTLAEQSYDDALFRGDTKKASVLKEKIDRYENEPGEGKKALMAKARGLEAERAVINSKYFSSKQSTLSCKYWCGFSSGSNDEPSPLVMVTYNNIRN